MKNGIILNEKTDPTTLKLLLSYAVDGGKHGRCATLPDVFNARLHEDGRKTSTWRAKNPTENERHEHDVDLSWSMQIITDSFLCAGRSATGKQIMIIVHGSTRGAIDLATKPLFSASFQELAEIAAEFERRDGCRYIFPSEELDTVYSLRKGRMLSAEDIERIPFVQTLIGTDWRRVIATHHSLALDLNRLAVEDEEPFTQKQIAELPIFHIEQLLSPRYDFSVPRVQRVRLNGIEFLIRDTRIPSSLFSTIGCADTAQQYGLIRVIDRNPLSGIVEATAMFSS